MSIWIIGTIGCLLAFFLCFAKCQWCTSDSIPGRILAYTTFMIATLWFGYHIVTTDYRALLFIVLTLLVGALGGYLGDGINLARLWPGSKKEPVS